MIAKEPLIRGTYIGGGDAAAIMGADPHRSILEVYLQKTKQIEEKDISNLIPVRVGKNNEPLVIEIFEERTGYKINNRQMEICNPDYPFIAGHIDGDYHDANGRLVLFEAKTTSARNNKKWDSVLNELPMEYYYQINHYLACHSEYEYATACVLIDNYEVKIVRIERNPEVIAGLIKRECEFWQMVQDKTPPEVTMAIDSNLMKRLYPNVQEQLLELTDEESIYAAFRLIQTRAEIKALEETEKIMKAKLQSKMKEADRAIAGDYSISWKLMTKTTIDTKALKKDYPEIAEKYSRTTLYREFGAKENKKKEV